MDLTAGFAHDFMRDQTDDELNKAINEHFGYKYYMGEAKWIHGRPPPSFTGPLNYAGSLDAMREAEKTLDWNALLWYIRLLTPLVENQTADYPALGYIWHADARQRAQAFVRTIAARTEREAKL